MKPRASGTGFKSPRASGTGKPGPRTFAKTVRLSVRVFEKIKKRFGFGYRLLIEKKGSVSVRFFMSKKTNILHVRNINIDSFLLVLV